MHMVQVGMWRVNGDVMLDGLDDGSFNIVFTVDFFEPFKNNRVVGDHKVAQTFFSESNLKIS